MHGQYAKTGLCHKLISYGARGPEREAREQLKASADYITSAVWWSDEMAHNARTTEFLKKFNDRYKRSPDWVRGARLRGRARRPRGRPSRRDHGSSPPCAPALTELKMESLLPGGFLAFPEPYGGQAQYLFVVQQNLPDGSAPVIYPRNRGGEGGVARPTLPAPMRRWLGSSRTDPAQISPSPRLRSALEAVAVSRREHLLAQAYVLRRDLHQLVLVDPLERPSPATSPWAS